MAEVGALQVFDARALRRWARLACDELAQAAAEIDALNVYPVPDRDTGTNLHLTLRSAVDALDQGDHQAELGAALDLMARGALLGARGNSGVIGSQLLRGLADRFGREGPADGAALAVALSHATDLAYVAVAVPVEGTILTVARAAADAAMAAASTEARPQLAIVTRAAADAGAQALARTPSLLPVLARAGVVDAGGRGLCVLLDTLFTTVVGHDSRGRASPGRQSPVAPRRPGPAAGSVPVPVPDLSAPGRPQGLEITYGYEVQFLLDDADDAAVDAMRIDLAALGDSLVIVGTGPTRKPLSSPQLPPSAQLSALWKVHVHVDDVGAAIEAGVRAGRPHSISVTRFADQGTGGTPVCRAAESERTVLTGSWSGRGLVAVAPGPGLAGLFAGEGVQVIEGASVVNGRATRHPSAADVLAAIRRTGAAEVVVLSNHSTVTAIGDVAAAQAREGGQDVAVVPTKSPVQGLAAIAVADPSRRFADVVIAMAEAAAATRWAEITVAAREAMTTAGRCAAGDVLGLAEGDVVLIGNDQVKVTCDLLDRLLSAGGELVTLVIGADALIGFTDEVRAHLRQAHPGVDVMDYRGGQPHQPVLIGVE
ncbi:MAG: DAK2 domain-containing protein [Actinomycetota bacterium]|nr:DAK2 domain-containing protein [Actinomycetota bacterium]